MQKHIVVLPGGYHPYHAGHHSLYQNALKLFPNSDLYVAASNDTSERPFPFNVKQKLAQLAGVDTNRFVQVANPFRPQEITSKYDGDNDILIFVRSEKDKNEEPVPGLTRKDGKPAYFQPYNKNKLQPFKTHAYFVYLPTVEFNNGMHSATEIRDSWPRLSQQQKVKTVNNLYPRTRNDLRLVNIAVKLLDTVLNDLSESKEKKMKKVDNSQQVIENARQLISKVKPSLKEASIEQKKKIVKILSEAKKLMNEAATYPKANLNIIKSYGNGYVLVYDLDRDYDVEKESFDVYYEVSPGQYEHVSSVNVSPYPNNRKPGEVDRKAMEIIGNHRGNSRDMNEADEMPAKNMSSPNYEGDDPLINSLIDMARQDVPEARNDIEAIFHYLAKKTIEQDQLLKKLKSELIKVERKMKELDKHKHPAKTLVPENKDYVSEKN